MDFELPNTYYRVSVKALIFDETRTKFLISLEDNGWWELPGGGLDHGENPADCLRREIKEEMGLEVTRVADQPSHYLIYKNMKGRWSIGLVFEVEVKDLNFTKSEECTEIKFISPDEVGSINAFRAVVELADKLKNGNA